VALPYTAGRGRSSSSMFEQCGNGVGSEDPGVSNKDLVSGASSPVEKLPYSRMAPTPAMQWDGETAASKVDTWRRGRGAPATRRRGAGPSEGDRSFLGPVFSVHPGRGCLGNTRTGDAR
jgi:hypothetical protein